MWNPILSSFFLLGKLGEATLKFRFLGKLVSWVSVCFYRSCGKFEIAFSPFSLSQFGSRICSLATNRFFVFTLAALALLGKAQQICSRAAETSLSYLVTFATLTSRLSIADFSSEICTKASLFFPVCESFFIGGAKWKENLRLSGTFLSSFTLLTSNRIKQRCWRLTKWLFSWHCELTD